jgi:hypothetical protein
LWKFFQASLLSLAAAIGILFDLWSMIARRGRRSDARYR